MFLDLLLLFFKSLRFVFLVYLSSLKYVEQYIINLYKSKRTYIGTYIATSNVPTMLSVSSIHGYTMRS